MVMNKGDQKALREALAIMKGRNKEKTKEACVQNAAGYTSLRMLNAYAKLYGEKVK